MHIVDKHTSNVIWSYCYYCKKGVENIEVMWTILKTILFLTQQALTTSNHGNVIEIVSHVTEILHIWLSLDPELCKIH